MSNAQFKADLSAFVQRANVSLETVIRKVALDLLAAIVGRSPVATGRFKGAWVVQRDLSANDPETQDKGGSATIARGATEIAGFKVGETRFIVNFLPYSVRLEDGYSGQAPAGVVKITVEEYQQYVRDAARSLAA